MQSLKSRYVIRETLISIFINTVLSFIFFYLQFHALAFVPWTGRQGFVRDALPQTFAISLMSVLAPTILTRRRGTLGLVPIMVKPRRIVPSRVIVRAFGVAIVAALSGFAGMYIVFGHDASGLSFRYALAFKSCYGALVAMIVTPVAVWMALHDAALSKT